MSTPDPQQPADPSPSGGAGSAAPTPGPQFDQPTAPAYGSAQPFEPQPFEPLPGQAYDAQTGLPLTPPAPQYPDPYGNPYSDPYSTPYGTTPYGNTAYGSTAYGSTAYGAQQSGPYGAPAGYGPQQPGWYGQGYGPYAPRPTNGMAIASLVLGILWLYWVGSILALVFGYIARQQIAQRGESGGGLATAGIVLGWIGVGTFFLMLFFVFVVAAGAPASSY
jgi:hypothetical protein